MTAKASVILNAGDDKMGKIKKNALLFGAGGIGYGILEILWRGYTHWSMVIAGGLCFVLFSLIAEKFKKIHIVYKSMLCAVVVTAVEFTFGVVLNILLKMDVWDYTDVPLNILGQVCLPFTLVWGILGFVFLPLADFINLKFKA